MNSNRVGVGRIILGHLFHDAKCLTGRHQTYSVIWQTHRYLTSSKYAEVPAKTEHVAYQNFLFDQKQNEQWSHRAPRIEKIKVNYKVGGLTDNAIMYMNKNISTPHNCAMHISRLVANASVLARITPTTIPQSDSTPLLNEGQTEERLLNAPQTTSEVTVQDQQTPPAKVPVFTDPSIIWDMHTPLVEDCDIEFLKFDMLNKDPYLHQQVNQAYWRSCSFVLGATLMKSFKNRAHCTLHNQPDVPVESGAFCYDVMMAEDAAEWTPNNQDLIYLTKVARSIVNGSKKFERLQVEKNFAMELFKDDPYHSSRITSFLQRHTEPDVTLYRLGDYIDVTDGPLVSDTSHIFHYVVTGFHRLDEGRLRRVQGVSLPEACKVHHTVWTMLENRARKLVTYGLDKTKSAAAKVDLFQHQSIEDETKEYSKATGQWIPYKYTKPTGNLSLQEN